MHAMFIIVCNYRILLLGSIIRVYCCFCCCCFGEKLITYVQLPSTLNLSSITSKFHSTGMLVIVELQTIFHTKFVGMFMIYRHTNFHMPSSNHSLVIPVKQKAKENFHTASMLLLHIL